MNVLNIGSGRIIPYSTIGDFQALVNVDYNYNLDKYDPKLLNITKEEKSNEFFINMDMYSFMETYPHKFDKVCAYRVLEHVDREKILYFIYLLSTILKKSGTLDIIVPNYRILANMILDENEDSFKNSDFEKRNIILTTELLNERNDPHTSIWTDNRLKYYFEYEKRFSVSHINPSYTFDGRDIYMRAFINLK